MKKVIEGKLYNTDTAKKIGQWDNGLCGSDINACTEPLYRTKSGTFFLHGVGGANTKYAQVLNENSWSTGEKIIPMTEETAKSWGKERLSKDDYESAFESVPSRKCVSAILREDQIKKLTLIKKKTGKTFSTLISEAVDLFDV